MKHTIQLCSVFLFILCSAMSCDDDYDYNTQTINCNLTDIKLHHINNEGRTPQIAEYKVKKEAYMLGIEFITDKEEPFFPDPNISYDYKLNNGITKISILRNQPASSQFLEEKVVTNDFMDYPLSLPDGIKDKTLKGDTLFYVNNTRLYKALVNYPEAGDYEFKIIITLSDETTIEKRTGIINLY